MIKQAKKGIWKFEDLLPPIETKYHLTLGEGATRLTQIENIFFKHEYENPTGSVKDRGIAYQISHLYSKNIKKAVISSSGNAAISAAHYCKLAGIELTVFVSPKINTLKLKQLTKLSTSIIKSSKPISDAFQYAKKNSAFNLRPSTDPVGHIGYTSIAYELDNQLSNQIDAIFFPVSSGTTLVGVGEGYQKLGYLPKFFAVQTTSVHPIASHFDENFTKTEKSLADALVAKYTPRQEEVQSLIKKSGGGGFVVSDEDILSAHDFLLKHDINCSYEGAAALAGLWKAQNKGLKFQYPVCLLTGKPY